MSRIRVFTDEDVYGAIAPQLRAKGLDAISTPEAKRLGERDEAQLSWALSERRILFHSMWAISRDFMPKCFAMARLTLVSSCRGDFPLARRSRS